MTITARYIRTVLHVAANGEQSVWFEYSQDCLFWSRYMDGPFRAVRPWEFD